MSQPALQAAVGLVTSVEEQEDCPKLTLQKLGLARALLAAGTALPHLYQQEPQVLPVLPLPNAVLCSALLCPSLPALPCPVDAHSVSLCCSLS